MWALESPHTRLQRYFRSIHFTFHRLSTTLHKSARLNMQSLASTTSAFTGARLAARSAARRAVAARVSTQASFFKTSTATKVRCGAARSTRPRGGVQDGP